MRRLLIFLLMAAAFVCGYYVRGLPGTPDLIDLSKDLHQRITRLAGGFSAAQAPHKAAVAQPSWSHLADPTPAPTQR